LYDRYKSDNLNTQILTGRYPDKTIFRQAIIPTIL
jgi:hypothetical protein